MSIHEDMHEAYLSEKICLLREEGYSEDYIEGFKKGFYIGVKEERTRIIEELRKSGMPEEQIRSIVFPQNENRQANV